MAIQCIAYTVNELMFTASPSIKVEAVLKPFGFDNR